MYIPTMCYNVAAAARRFACCEGPPFPPFTHRYDKVPCRRGWQVVRSARKVPREWREKRRRRLVISVGEKASFLPACFEPEEKNRYNRQENQGVVLHQCNVARQARARRIDMLIERRYGRIKVEIRYLLAAEHTFRAQPMRSSNLSSFREPSRSTEESAREGDASEYSTVMPTFRHIDDSGRFEPVPEPDQTHRRDIDR